VGTDGNIYTIDQNAGNRSAITQDAGEGGLVYSDPIWSPDSNRLSYIGVSGRASTVFTADPNGSNPIQVYTSREYTPFYFYWSPDSQYVSFLSGTLTDSDLSLQIVPARGGETRILDTGQPYYWDWSPDSQTIFIHTGGAFESNPDARLATLSPEPGKPIEPLDLRPTSFQAPAWSPGGDKLLLAIDSQEAEGTLAIVSPGGELLQELDVLNGPTAFAWSPDGSRVAWLYSRSGAQGLLRGLKVVEPGPAQEAIVVADENVVAFFWSPDSNKIAYILPSLPSDRSPDTETIGRKSGLRTIGQRRQPDLQISLRIKVYDLESGDNLEVIQFVPSEDFLNILPFFDQFHRSSRLWSPDRNHLVISAIDERGDPGIFVIDAAGGEESIRIASGVMAYWSWK